MDAKFVSTEPILTEEQKMEFEREYQLTSDSQKDYRHIISGIISKMGIDAKKAEELTGLNRALFNNLEKSDKGL